jgi:tetratricopeptide (TPR) repeat protein
LPVYRGQLIGGKPGVLVKNTICTPIKGAYFACSGRKASRYFSSILHMVSVFAGICVAPQSRKPHRSTWLWVACVVVGAFALPAWAQESAPEQAQRWARAGQWTQARDLVQTHLAEHPSDVQMRLLQGVVQQRLGQLAQAQTSFELLTRDHPELPEPHNNLAVLQAQAGQLEEARTHLEQALRLNPQYGTAYHNLADVNLQLAAQAYARAADLDATGQAPALRQRATSLMQLLMTTPLQ